MEVMNIMAENEVYKKEFTDEEIAEAKKHIQVLKTFEAGEEVSISDENSQKEKTTEDKKVDKMLGKELRDKNNVFDNVFGKGYGSRFAQIMNANIVDRFWLMDSVVSFANQDPSITDKQRKLISDMDEAFRDACCMDGPSKRLMEIINHKPNLQKMIKPARLQRTFDTIDLPIHRLRFNQVPSGSYIPLFFSSFAVCYGWENLEFDIAYSKNTDIKQPTGHLLAALLAKYANYISPYDYANMWFVLMFVKNLSVCSITNKELFNSDPEVLEYGKNLLKLADHMLNNCANNIFASNMIKVQNKDSIYDVQLQTPKDSNDNVVEIEI
jgi:hypothetical protein